MTIPHEFPSVTALSLIERIKAELRPEFSADFIVVDTSDPIMGGPLCLVSGCTRLGVICKMCAAHQQQWITQGRPVVSEWINTPWTLKLQLLPRKCSVVSCHRSRRNRNLCHTHHLRWLQDGRPRQAEWLPERSGPPLNFQGQCNFPRCECDAEGMAGLCYVHRGSWIRMGRPPVATFIRKADVIGADHFDLSNLPMPMRIEVAYAIQRRVDERRSKTRPDLLHRVLNQLGDSGASSLLDHSTESWNRKLGFLEKGSVPRRFLLDAIGYLVDMVEGIGWEAEYPRDVWLLRRIGYPGRDKAFHFDEIEPLWLRSLTKRWTRWRLSTGIEVITALAGVHAIKIFSQSCSANIQGPKDLTRSQIESYLAYLAIRYPVPKSRRGHIGSLASLLQTSRRHNWEPELNPTADIYPEDYPSVGIGSPRALSEVVMARLERKDNLDRFGDPQALLIAKILMGTGLRVGDACKLGLDCIKRDNLGAPYLHYTNHKMSREAFVPITLELAEAITRHQPGVSKLYPKGTCLLPRTTRNPDGTIPYSPATFRQWLGKWLVDCDIRDELGRLVHLTPHQWRHTYGTRLINSEVPQETVRRLLDHSSHNMTAHYARLSDKTIREQWERAQKVNSHGEFADSEVGLLSEAVWMNNNLARAKMALPNGYCALPLQQSCEYANACLTCPVFVTTAEFLPQHRRHLESTRILIAQADERGHQRVAEMNRSVETNLEAIIAALSPINQEAF